MAKRTLPNMPARRRAAKNSVYELTNPKRLFEEIDDWPAQQQDWFSTDAFKKTDALNSAAIEAADASWALRMAECGDWREVVDRVRSGAKLSRKEREFVADIIDGKIKRPKHRHISFETSSLQFKVAAHVVWAEANGIRIEPAVAQAMQQFRMGRSSVYAALKKFRQSAEEVVSEILSEAPPKAAGYLLSLWYLKATR